MASFRSLLKAHIFSIEAFSPDTLTALVGATAAWTGMEWASATRRRVNPQGTDLTTKLSTTLGTSPMGKGTTMAWQ